MSDNGVCVTGNPFFCCYSFVLKTVSSTAPQELFYGESMLIMQVRYRFYSKILRWRMVVA